LRLSASIILMFISIPLHAQDIEWNDRKRLTFESFEGAQDPTRPDQKLALAFGLEVKVKKEDVRYLETFNAQVVSLFAPGQSWIEKGNKSALRFANLLFDLNEWRAREVRKRLAENQQRVIAGEGNMVYEDVKTEFDRYHQTVGSETDSGKNETGMMTWETRVQERLIALAEYCKKCK
jgi:hypothetical protein